MSKVAAAAASTAEKVVKSGAKKGSGADRLFFKDQEMVDGFKVFDPYMNKRRPPMIERSKRVWIYYVFFVSWMRKI